MDELQTLAEKVDALNREREIEQQKKTRLENSCTDHQSHKSQLENDLAEKSSCLEKEKEVLAASERRLREDKATLEAQHHTRDVLARQIKAAADKRQRQLAINTEVENTNAEKRLAVRTKAKELKDIDKDIVTMKRQRELVARKMTSAEEDRVRYEAHLDIIKLEKAKAETSLTVARKEDEAQRRQIEALERESTILQRNLDLSQRDARVYDDLIRTNQIALKNLESESIGIASTLRAHRKMIARIDMEKKRFEDNVQLAQRQHAEATDQLRQQEMDIVGLRKKAQSGELSLKKQQHAYEKVQIESHHRSSHLVEVQEELDKVRRRYHILHRHIGQIQDEIGRTNEVLAAEHYQHFRADDESSKLRQDIAILHRKIASTELHVRNNDLTMKNLNAAIDTKDETISRLKKQYCAMMSERDVTCAHLVTKRDDLRNLKLKLQSQQSLLHHGEVMFDDQKEQIASLSEERQGLQEDKKHLLSQAQEAKVIVEQFTKLERELQRERAKKKVLQNDLGRPINIHRWRFLEVKDPERYGLLQRAHRLQRRILDAADEIAEKEGLIQSKQAMYEAAKSNVGRMPTVSSLQAQVREQANAIKSKTEDIQKMNAEVLSNRRWMVALKLELEVINEEYRALELDWVQSAGETEHTTFSTSLAT
jgi:chromosome segregation ATPase